MIQLGDYLDRPSVQSAVQRLAEEVANHVSFDEKGSSAKFHEQVEDTVSEAVEDTVRSLTVEDWCAWPSLRGVAGL